MSIFVNLIRPRNFSRIQAVSHRIGQQAHFAAENIPINPQIPGIDVWKVSLGKINNFIKETVEMARGLKEFKSETFKIINPEKGYRHITLPIEGKRNKQICFRWAEGDIKLERINKQKTLILRFTDNNGRVREFKWIKDGFKEIKYPGITKKEWKDSLTKINSYVKETVEMARGLKEFKSEILEFINPDKRGKQIKLLIKRKKYQLTGFRWAEGKVKLERLKDIDDIFLRFTDNKGKMREFKWMKDGFKEIKLEWKEGLAKINNYVKETIIMARGTNEFNSDTLEIINPDKKGKGIYLPIEGKKYKQICFNWTEGKIKLDRMKDGNSLILRFTDSKGRVREFKWITDGFEEIKQEWKVSLGKINDYIKETVEMTRGAREFKSDTLEVINPEKKLKGINLPIEGKINHGIGFNWAEGRVKLERLKVGDEIILRFTDSKGKMREFKWIKEGFKEIKTDYHVDKVDVEHLYLLEILKKSHEQDKKDSHSGEIERIELEIE